MKARLDTRAMSTPKPSCRRAKKEKVWRKMRAAAVTVPRALYRQLRAASLPSKHTACSLRSSGRTFLAPKSEFVALLDESSVLTAFPDLAPIIPASYSS